MTTILISVILTEDLPSVRPARSDPIPPRAKATSYK
jgi:hypothetical protein